MIIHLKLVSLYFSLVLQLILLCGRPCLLIQICSASARNCLELLISAPLISEVAWYRGLRAISFITLQGADVVFLSFGIGVQLLYLGATLATTAWFLKWAVKQLDPDRATKEKVFCISLTLSCSV